MKKQPAIATALLIAASMPLYAQKAKSTAEAPATGTVSGSPTTTINGGNSGASVSGNTTQSGTTNVNSTESYTTVSNSSERVNIAPPVTPPTPPSQVAVGDMIKETGSCGPIQTVTHTPYYKDGGLLHGKVLIGYRDNLEPGPTHYVYETEPDGLKHIFGTQVTTVYSLQGVSKGRNVAMGGFAGSGTSGQAGAGSTNSYTYTNVTIEVSVCELGVVEPPLPPATPVAAAPSSPIPSTPPPPGPVHVILDNPPVVEIPASKGPTTAPDLTPRRKVFHKKRVVNGCVPSVQK